MVAYVLTLSEALSTPLRKVVWKHEKKALETEEGKKEKETFCFFLKEPLGSATNRTQKGWEQGLQNVLQRQNPYFLNCAAQGM